MGIFQAPRHRVLLISCVLHSLHAFAPRAPLRSIFGVSSLSTTPLKLSSTAINAQQNTTAPSSSGPTDVTEKTVAVQRDYETFMWKRQGSEAEYKINYRVEGPADGPPVLLTHGFGANVNHFRYQFPALVKEGYRVYAVDLIGFGASAKPADVPYSIELFVELLRDFVVDQQGKGSYSNQWIFAGNSIGGLCSLALAKELKSLVKGIVLFNCSGGMSGFRYEDLPLYLHPFMYFLQKVVLGPTWGGRFFENFKTRQNVESILKEAGVYQDTTNVDDELMEVLLGPSDDEGAKDVFLKVFAGPPGPTPEALLPEVSDVPILLCWGQNDPWTPFDGGLHAGSKFEGYHQGSKQGAEKMMTTALIMGCGHCPHDENPKAVHEYMLPFMKQLYHQDSKEASSQ